MDAENVTHSSVETALHRDEATGRYLFGVVLHGEFIPLVESKLGRIDKWLARGKAREAEQQQQPPTQPTQPTP